MLLFMHKWRNLQDHGDLTNHLTSENRDTDDCSHYEFYPAESLKNQARPMATNGYQFRDIFHFFFFFGIKRVRYPLRSVITWEFLNMVINQTTHPTNNTITSLLFSTFNLAYRKKTKTFKIESLKFKHDFQMLRKQSVANIYRM